MNLANIFTISRIIISPILCFYILNNKHENHYKFIPILFIIACLTDSFDGLFARRNKKVTSFGKIMDPIADKILAFSVMLCLLNQKLINTWIIIFLITREFFMSSTRILLAKKNIIYSANIFGKLKTLLQFSGIISLLLYSCEVFDPPGSHIFLAIGTYLLWISVIFSIISLMQCILNNKSCIIESIKE